MGLPRHKLPVKFTSAIPIMSKEEFLPVLLYSFSDVLCLFLLKRIQIFIQIT